MGAQKDLERRLLVIDASYLSNLPKDDPYSKLDKDLASLTSESEVRLIPPSGARLSSLYTDIRAHVAVKSIPGGYKIKVADAYEGNKIRAILGGRVSGSLETGYSFKERYA